MMKLSALKAERIVVNCLYCGWREGSHAVGCPGNGDSVSDEKKWRLWCLGWDEGRVGNECLSDDPSFILGYIGGVRALESCENGFDYH